MKQEDKELLLKDLCARLPYSVVVAHRSNVDNVYGIMSDIDIFGNAYIRHYGINKVEDVKPYLRPMSSMTEIEKIDFNEIQRYNVFYSTKGHYTEIDWLNAHHFDYRGLIEKGLALEAPDGMYSIKEK